MLWAKDSGQHPQPMTHFVDEAGAAVWYITSAETDLAQAVALGTEGGLTVVSENQDYHASLKGRMEFVQDSDKLDELWSIPAAAWFKEGREDPTIRLLRFIPSEASIWASEDNVLLVGLKLIRAGVSRGADQPDIGVHHVLHFAAAA